MGERINGLLEKGWTNFHCHTNMDSCCDPEMTPAFYAGLLGDDIRRVVITDHGFMYYFADVEGISWEVIWHGKFMEEPEWFDRARETGNKRVRDKMKEVRGLGNPDVFFGIETDVMCDGRFTHDPQFAAEFDVILCGPHFMPWIEKLESAADREKKWLDYMDMLLAKPEVDVLSHPFRWIANVNKGNVSDEAVECILRWVEERGVALELNGNPNTPEAAEVRMLTAAADRGLPIVVSTDAHHRDQIKNLALVEHRLALAGLTANDLCIPEAKDFIARKGRRKDS